jgi:hypothetical protein
MSTTVILSRHGFALNLLPAMSPALKPGEVARVLARHGLALIDGSDLALANEVIAAEGLPPAEAVRLADDLRALGLTVRVVNRTGLTMSRRVGNALAGQFVLAMGGLLTIMAGQATLAEGGMVAAAVMMAVGAAMILSGALTALTLQRRGGASLRVAGQVADPAAQLTEQLAGLTEHLPEHLVAPMLDRARKLEVHARRDPQGEAAQELAALVAELSGHEAQAAADEARKLREEVTRARRAMQETQRS